MKFVNTLRVFGLIIILFDNWCSKEYLIKMKGKDSTRIVNTRLCFVKA